MIISSREELERMQADGELSVDDADEVRTFMDFLEAAGPTKGQPGYDRERFVKAYAEYYPEDYAEALAAQARAKAAEVRACRVCGCTDDHACPGGCFWVGPDLCSRCQP